MLSRSLYRTPASYGLFCTSDNTQVGIIRLLTPTVTRAATDFDDSLYGSALFIFFLLSSQQRNDDGKGIKATFHQPIKSFRDFTPFVGSLVPLLSQECPTCDDTADSPRTSATNVREFALFSKLPSADKTLSQHDRSPLYTGLFFSPYNDIANLLPPIDNFLFHPNGIGASCHCFIFIFRI